MKRRLEISCLLIAMFSQVPPAFADGLGGLSAIPILMAMVVAAFAIPATLVGVVIYLMRRSRNSEQKLWLADPEIPRGLRAMALMQYILAAIYGLTAVFLRGMPPMRTNGEPSDWVVHLAYFDFALSVALVVTATGIINRSFQAGYQGGRLVGWACVINTVIHLTWHGPTGMSLITPLFGIVLLATLKWGHRDFWHAASPG